MCEHKSPHDLLLSLFFPATAQLTDPAQAESYMETKFHGLSLKSMEDTDMKDVYHDLCHG